MKKLLLAALMALASITAAFATAYTSSFTVTSSAWVDLGAGPLLVTTLNPSDVSGDVWIYISDAQPSASLKGNFLKAGTPMEVQTSSHVWARSGSSTSTTIIASTISAAGGGGGGAVTQSGTWNVGLSAGSNVVGAVTQSGSWTVSPSAATTGGASMAKLLSAASTNATSVKGSAGTLYALAAINTTTTVYYLKLYDKATAPTCNSDTVAMTLPVPPAGAAGQAGGFVVPVAVGAAFSSGIGACLTGGLADNDNTSAATGVAVNFFYK